MSDEARDRALSLLQRHGWNATSFQTLEPGCRYFFLDDAFVAYVDTGAAWVAAGAPVCEPARLREVTTAFVAAARAEGRRAQLFAVEPRFTDAIDFAAFRIGEQPVWDPAGWSSSKRGSRSLREQIRRARAKGVVVRALASSDVAEGAAARAAIDALLRRWVASRPMPKMGFLVELAPFSYPDERRYFLAEREGHAVGFLAAVPVYARDGFFFEDLLRDPAAPNGTAELLVDHAMTELGARGVRYVTLGLAPLAGDVPPALKLARQLSRGLYDFEGLRSFKAKLRPTRWDPILLAYPKEQGPLTAIVDTLTAFSRGGLLRFGVETIFRVPTPIVQLLAALLIPWTIGLSLAKSATWFPAPWVKVAWVLFDVAVCAALWSLARRWRRGLATIVATAVTLDALVTASEALLWNVPRAHELWEHLVLATAILAPTTAAIALWRARSVRARV
jgi:phosphatidylglycerol lysyltransferase